MTISPEKPAHGAVAQDAMAVVNDQQAVAEVVEIAHW